MKTKFITAVVLIVSLSACSDTDSKVAKVDGKAITKSDFDTYLQHKRLTPRDDKSRESVLDRYLEREALAVSIEDEGKYDKKMLEVEVDEFRKEAIISRYFERFLQDKVSDDAVQNYYSANAAKYEESKVHVAHMLFRVGRTMSETERKAKLTSAQAAHARLKSGKPFDKVARDFSEDAVSAKKGGDLGWLKQGAIDQRFSEKVFSMKPGEVSEPFETNFGFHIVQLLEGPVVVKRPFESVQGDIRYQLRNEVKEAEVKRLMAEIKIKKY